MSVTALNLKTTTEVITSPVSLPHEGDAKSEHAKLHPKTEEFLKLLEIPEKIREEALTIISDSLNALEATGFNLNNSVSISKENFRKIIECLPNGKNLILTSDQINKLYALANTGTKELDLSRFLGSMFWMSCGIPKETFSFVGDSVDVFYSIFRCCHSFNLNFMGIWGVKEIENYLVKSNDPRTIFRMDSYCCNMILSHATIEGQFNHDTVFEYDHKSRKLIPHANFKKRDGEPKYMNDRREFWRSVIQRELNKYYEIHPQKNAVIVKP